MTERLPIPRDREAILADHAELIGYGVAPIDAAARLGVTEADIRRMVNARESADLRARKLAARRVA